MAQQAQGRPSWLHRRRAVAVPLAVTFVAALIVWALMNVLRPYLPDRGGLLLLPAYINWFPKAATGDVLSRVLWVIGDLTEGSFMNSVAASLGMAVFLLAGAAYSGTRERLRGKGGPTFAATAITLGFSTLSCALTTLIFGWTLEGGWAPTFSSFLLSMILINFYGPTIAHAATVAVAMALVPCPVCLLLQNGFSVPLGLPPFAAVGMGMAIVTVLLSEVFRLMPWMQRTAPRRRRRRRRRPPSLQRSDFVGAVFSGIADMCGATTPLAGAGMLLGLLVGWELSPTHAVYGQECTAALVLSLVSASAITAFVHFDELERTGSLFTFAGLLVVGSIVTTYGTHPVILVPTVLTASVAVPWMVSQVVARTPLGTRWPASVYAQMIAASVTIALACWANLVLIVFG